MHPSLDLYVVLAPGIVGQQVQDEAVLILPERGQVKVINDVAAFIWAQINGRQTVEQIAAAVHTTYDVSLEQARDDTLAFIHELVRQRMLVLTVRPADQSTLS